MRLTPALLRATATAAQEARALSVMGGAALATRIVKRVDEVPLDGDREDPFDGLRLEALVRTAEAGFETCAEMRAPACFAAYGPLIDGTCDDLVAEAVARHLRRDVPADDVAILFHGLEDCGSDLPTDCVSTQAAAPCAAAPHGARRAGP